MNRHGGARGTLLLAAAALSGTMCRSPLNHSGVQCATDDDCASLGNHPYCLNSVCVPSGLQPEMCFFVDPPKAIPVAQADFLNACSPDTCLSFSTPFDSGAMLRTPPPVSPPVVAPGASPTSVCKDLVPAGKQIAYITGSSNFAALLQDLSPVIVDKTNIVPVFRTTSSCTGVRSMNPDEPDLRDGPLHQGSDDRHRHLRTDIPRRRHARGELSPRFRRRLRRPRRVGNRPGHLRRAGEST